MSQPSSTHTTRPSRLLPQPIFEAILRLEDQVRAEAPVTQAEAHIFSVIETGRRRDELAALLLAAVVPA